MLNYIFPSKTLEHNIIDHYWFFQIIITQNKQWNNLKQIVSYLCSNVAY